VERIVTVKRKVKDPSTTGEAEVSIDLLVEFEIDLGEIIIRNVEDAVFGRVLYGKTGDAFKSLTGETLDEIEMKVKKTLEYETGE